MNMKYIYVITILAIAMISIGCVDNTSEKVTSTNAPIQTNVPDITDVSNNASVTGTTDISDNVSTYEVEDVPDNTSVPDTTNVSGNVAVTEVIDVTDNAPTPDVTDNAPTSDVTYVPTESTSVTETFKIGDTKNVLNMSVTLMNITNYDSNALTLSIDGATYEYNVYADSNIQVNGREIIDVITDEDNQTAEITVDYVSQ